MEAIMLAHSWKDQFPPRFFKISFSFATFQALGKMPYKIGKLQSAGMGFANILAPSFKNLPERLSTSAALEFSIFVIIFKKYLSSEVLFKQNSSETMKLE